MERLMEETKVDNQVTFSLDRLFQELKALRGFDLSGYRRNMVLRQVAARMAAVNIIDGQSYLDYLRDNPQECNLLIDRMGVNVSRFFRDPVVFELLGRDVLPDLLRNLPSGRGNIRAWSAGCSEGEEAYSIAMMIHFIMNARKHEGKGVVVATDIDCTALARGKRAIYNREQVLNVRLGMVEKYLINRDNSYEVCPEIREMVQYSWDDLTVDENLAPIEGIAGTFDLVFCRNMLIYFNAPIKKRVLTKLIKALRPGGYLVLGDSEFVDSETATQLEEVDFKSRIFRKPKA